ncbi:MAG: circularly permuted type 2 ATP-grasp protein [Pirellulales bacterium]|nr:circularly permuted type 2 ATP-grasp protein [Pirellulales bacterium]
MSGQSEMTIASSAAEPSPDLGAVHWLAKYRGVPGHWDEMLAADGALRPSWRPLVDALRTLGDKELQRQDDLCRRVLREYGVTYNPPGQAAEWRRPWQLDSWPMVMSAEEWRLISAGVAQRARLLNAVLADVYGPHRLLLGGSLPPEVVFANPAFLRAAHDIQPPGGAFLANYAVDLARSPDGRWWVVGDRTDTPTGVGYALENRIVLSRVHAALIRDCLVQRLARHFSRWRDSLLEYAGAAVDEPRVVIYTPGSYHATYFEQAYLARYLGFNLVEGADLTVRDQGVFLKTLSGLLPVHVILRNVDSDYCDPLELREDSLLGVPGLLQAARAGKVTIVNAIGSGVVQVPALLPFLPGLCRTLLGEELLLPPVATWWCGEEQALQMVRSNFERLVIKHAFSEREHPPVIVSQLDERAQTELLNRVLEAPYRYVAQEFVALSSSPTWQGGALVPRHVTMRVYAVAVGDGEYQVMPGALTRASSHAESVLASTQTSGGSSKDTWVLAHQADDGLTLIPQGTRAAALSRAGFVLPSRLADDLFWLGRYVERLEFGCRLTRTLLHRLSDQLEISQLDEFICFLKVYIAHGRRPLDAALEAGNTKPQHLQRWLEAAVFDTANPRSLAADVTRLQAIALAVRDRLSNDAWRILNSLTDQFETPRASLLVDEQLARMDTCIERISAFNGQAMDDMTRDQGWRFLDTGRRLERAADLADLLRLGMVDTSGLEAPRLWAILETSNSLMTYRSRYVFGPDAAPVLDLLLADEANPRSVAFQLAALLQHVQALRSSDQADTSEQVRLVRNVFSSVRLADVDALVRVVDSGKREALAERLAAVTSTMEELSQLLTRRYLTHAYNARPLKGSG